MRSLRVALGVISFLLLTPIVSLADTIDDGCPCGTWPATNCTSSVIAITVDDPMPAGSRECGDNGTSTITLTLSSDRVWGCYADEYHVWIEDAGSGVGITSSSGDDYMIDPTLPVVTAQTPWIKATQPPSSIDADGPNRPISLTLANRPGYSTMNMASGCSSGNYGDLEFAYTVTIVPEIPADNGETIIRPAWAGTTKAVHSTNDIDWSILPTFNANDAGMPTLMPAADIIPRCIVESYHFATAGWNNSYPVFNFQQYNVDGNHKFSECGLHMAFSQGTNAPTLDQRKRMSIGMITNGIAMMNYIRNHGNGTDGGYLLNSGYGQNALLPTAFSAAFFPAKRAEYKNRFITPIGSRTGHEIDTDGGVWRHGNGNVYFGSGWPSDTPGAGYEPCAGKESGTTNNTCRHLNGTATDVWPNAAYLSCCVVGNWYGQAGVVYAFPKVYELVAGTNPDTTPQGGRKWFDFLERYNDSNFGSPTHGTNRSNLAHKEATSTELYDTIRSCSVTLSGSGISVVVASYDASCTGHTLISDNWNVVASTPERTSCITSSADCDNIDVTLTGSGSASGDVHHEIDCNAADGLDYGDGGGEPVINANTSHTFVDVCNYDALGAGEYTITVRSTRDGNIATDQTIFTVNEYTIELVCACDSPCEEPASADCTSTATFATGTSTHLGDCNNDLAYGDAATGDPGVFTCTGLTEGEVTIGAEGTDSDSDTAVDTDTFTVAATPTKAVSVTIDPTSGFTPAATTITASADNYGSDTTTWVFECDGDGDFNDSCNGGPSGGDGEICLCAALTTGTYAVGAKETDANPDLSDTADFTVNPEPVGTTWLDTFTRATNADVTTGCVSDGPGEVCDWVELISAWSINGSNQLAVASGQRGQLVGGASSAVQNLAQYSAVQIESTPSGIFPGPILRANGGSTTNDCFYAFRTQASLTDKYALRACHSAHVCSDMWVGTIGIFGTMAAGDSIGMAVDQGIDDDIKFTLWRWAVGDEANGPPLRSEWDADAKVTVCKTGGGCDHDFDTLPSAALIEVSSSCSSAAGNRVGVYRGGVNTVVVMDNWRGGYDGSGVASSKTMGGGAGLDGGGLSLLEELNLKIQTIGLPHAY